MFISKLFDNFHSASIIIMDILTLSTKLNRKFRVKVRNIFLLFLKQPPYDASIASFLFSDDASVQMRGAHSACFFDALPGVQSSLRFLHIPLYKTRLSFSHLGYLAQLGVQNICKKIMLLKILHFGQG